MSKVNTRATINAEIKQNGNQEITGQVLNSVLNTMVDDYAEQEKLTELESEVINIKPIVINGDVTNAPDEEDITMGEDNLLKLKNRTAFNGKGYVILRKNKTFAEQVTKENTIYEIRYEHNLAGASVKIASNCVLFFNGGCLKNGTIEGVSDIKADRVQIFDLDLEVKGYSGWFYPEWYGAKGDGVHDDTAAIQKFNGKSVLLAEKEYLCTNLEFNSYTNIKGVHKFNSCLKQADYTTGDFIRLVNWFAGTMDTLRVEGNSSNARGDNRWNGLIKVVNFTYKHEDVRGWEDRDISTNYSRLNNILIRNAPYSGLVVIGKYEEDDGKATEYNWIHHFGDIHIVNANEYGIYDSATDNLWQFINVTHCGWANVYVIGSAEQFSTLKLDGESGFNGDSELSEKELSSHEYRYAGLIILGGGNQFFNLEVQSTKQVGIKLQGSNNIIYGDVNNWGMGVRDIVTNEHYFPALQFLSRKVYNNVICLSMWPATPALAGDCPLYWSSDVYWDAGYYTHNYIQINYRDNEDDFDYSDFLSSLTKLETKDNLISNVRYNNNRNKALSENVSKALDQSPRLYIAYVAGEYCKVATKEEWESLASQGIESIGLYVELGKDSFIISKNNLGSVGVFANEGESMDFMPANKEGDAMFDFSGVESTMLRQSHQANSPNEDIFHIVADFNYASSSKIAWYIPSGGEAYIMYLHRSRINEYLSFIGGELIGKNDVIATSTRRDEYYSYGIMCNNGLVYPFLNTSKQSSRPITKGIVSKINPFGSDSERPSSGLYIGRVFFNKTLNKPIWWSGAGWVDAMGTIV